MDVGDDTESRRREPARGPRGFSGQQRTATLGIEEYAWVLRRQWALIALVTLVSLAMSVGYLTLASNSAVATTTLSLNAITTEPFSSQRPASGLLDAQAEAGIARSNVVAVRASQIIGPPSTPAQVRAASEVETGASATVVNVRYTAPTAAEAVAGADAVAAAYLGFRSDQAEARVEKIVSTLTAQIDTLNETLNDTNTVIADTPSSSAENIQAQTKHQQVLAELNGLLAERNALRSVDTTGGMVLSDADSNPIIHLPPRAMTVLLGLASGGVLGIIAAFVINPFDRRIRTLAELSRILQAPVLSALPNGRGVSKRRVGDGVAIARERLLTDMAPGACVLLLDSTGDDAASATAVELREWFASEGHPVVVVAQRALNSASLIVALREADAVVVLYTRGSLNTADARWIRDEATVSGTPVLGIIECRPGSRWNPAIRFLAKKRPTHPGCP